MLAKHALSQLSYGPVQTAQNTRTQLFSTFSFRTAVWIHMVGLGRLELPTSRLSSARSNQLSYKPQALASSLLLTPASRRRRDGVGIRNLDFVQDMRASRLVLEERETKAAKSRIDGPDMDRLFQVIR